jgi:hypothetical protein
MYRSCSCLGYAAGFFNLTCCSQNNMPASGRSSTTATAKLLTCTLLKFPSEPHDCDTHHQWSETPPVGFEARQYRHETLLLAKRVSGEFRIGPHESKVIQPRPAFFIEYRHHKS